MDAPVIEFRRVSLAFDDKVVLRDVSFTLDRAHTKIVIGASGSGKSTILRLILGLLKPDSGEVLIHGERVDTMSEDALMHVRAGLGMVFQEGALFDSLTVRENVGYRLFEETNLPVDEVDTRVREVLGFVGLSEYFASMPSDLSGGQRRRVAIARALTAKPKVLLYDEPTTGLDPIMKLRDLEGVSAVLVTHQLRDAFYIATHEAVAGPGGLTVRVAAPEKAAMTEFLMLKDGLVGFEGAADELRHSDDPYVKAFLS